ncbi:nucleoside-diphosphate kinase [uncultured Cytophaga sp.]|uniref:nucleoside-diphosphate kinase n=1 Tax=uncultured Cytophaga sp. TaxID=160238 RepID=UPI00261C8257|nr:nucleoside-diphosphate kinase [uncultured Cytophaga sp.]
MAGNRTFSMIKPDAVRDGHVGSILKMIEGGGFRIVAMKLTYLSAERAGQFYSVHTGKPFFDGLVSIMSESAIVALVLEKENAVGDFRKFIGSTNPANAEEGTVRKVFAKSMERNAVHGSDSDENAELEASFFFSKMEQY